MLFPNTLNGFIMPAIVYSWKFKHCIKHSSKEHEKRFLLLRLAFLIGFRHEAIISMYNSSGSSKQGLKTK